MAQWVQRSKLMAIATKIYNNRETPKTDKLKGWSTLYWWLTGAGGLLDLETTSCPKEPIGKEVMRALGTPSQKKKNQCAYSKEMGHWKKKFPWRKKGQKRPKNGQKAGLGD